jgi:DNA-binding NarL/FixJ family response regulator
MQFTTASEGDREPNPASDNAPALFSISFAVRSGLPLLDHVFITHLESLGFRHDPTAPLSLILDSPHGFAFATFKSLAPFPCGTRPVVITTNLCLEYLEDLWDLGLSGLVVSWDNTHELSQALMRAEQGLCYRSPSPDPTTLTPIERHIFRLLVDGMPPKQIAERLNRGYQHVKNTLTGVYGKLGLTSQCEAVLYYWRHRPTQ